jgi:hypothetical protein
MFETFIQVYTRSGDSHRVRTEDDRMISILRVSGDFTLLSEGVRL